MAGRILAPQATPAFDSDGAPISGATLSFFENGDVNTPKAAYPTAADANAGTNGFTSLTANSAGRFVNGSSAVIDPFGPDDARYTVIWKDAGGSQLARFDDVQVQGETEGVIYRDFDSDGRYRVFGAGGIVQIEAGDPTGDDTGGDLRIGGWESTQGTTLELDFATITHTGNDSIAGNLDVGGGLTVGGLEVGMLRVGSGSVSAGATLDIALPTDSENYYLEFRHFSVATDREIIAVRYGYGSPAVIRATDYATIQTLNTAGTLSGVSAAAATQAPITSQMNGATVNAQAFRMWISTRGGGIMALGSYEGDIGAGAQRSTVHTEAWNEGNTNPITSLRFLCAASSGSATGNNLSLTYVLWKVLTS